MTRVYIHIGLHKTGTSSLQGFLQRKAGELARHGVLYTLPPSPWPNHHALAASFSRSGVKPWARDFVRRVLDSAGERAVLFSSEMFCEADFDVSAFLAEMQGHDARILAYLRNPCDQIVSAHSQQVRAPKFRRTAPVHGRPRPYDPSYERPLKDWIAAGGLILCPYDPPQWRQGSLIGDFLAMIGLSGALDPGAAPRDNVSLAPPLVEVIRQMNIAGVPDEPRAEIVALLEATRIPPAPYPMTEAQCAEIIRDLAARLPVYQPLFRPGIDPAFLLRNPAVPG